MSFHSSEHSIPQFVSQPCEDFPALAVTSADLRAVGIQGVFLFLVALLPDKSTCCGRDGLGRAVSGCVVMLKARLCQPLHQFWLVRDCRSPGWSNGETSQECIPGKGMWEE